MPIMKIVECVANISEGRDTSVIQAIAKAAEDGGAAILDVDSGISAGRTVITFAAPLEIIATAACNFIIAASELIDMRKHSGVHPCIGAADVIPFVPLGETTFEECLKLAESVAEKVSSKIHIPTFLYGGSAKKGNNVKLSSIRKGGYHGLMQRLKNNEITPDFGRKEVTPAGGTIIGARPLMLAYNITLATPNKDIASEIAAKIRTSGKIKRDANNNVMRDNFNQPLRIAGMFQNLEAIGWYIEDFKRAQISTNIRNITSPALHEVYEACKTEAKSLGTEVTGSEIVGLLPLKSLLITEKYYKKEEAPDPEFSAAIKGLNLTDVKPFSVTDKVLEKRLEAFNLI